MNEIKSDFIEHRKALRRDSSMLIADIQALLRDIVAEVDNRSERTRDEIAGRLHALQARLSSLRREQEVQVGQWVDATDRYAHEHPWRSMSIVAAFAAAAGALAAHSLRQR
ncbi:hypothetical protein D3C87_944950 [compost metagenome]|uniref:DUF883 family protein n=1 Tax=Cupriavidus sp. SIMBA_020 TaxID=3085766 RepID=UPI000FA2AE92